MWCPWLPHGPMALPRQGTRERGERARRAVINRGAGCRRPSENLLGPAPTGNNKPSSSIAALPLSRKSRPLRRGRDRFPGSGKFPPRSPAASAPPVSKRANAPTKGAPRPFRPSRNLHHTLPQEIGAIDIRSKNNTAISGGASRDITAGAVGAARRPPPPPPYLFATQGASRPI
jgi:hypothetical protein